MKANSHILALFAVILAILAYRATFAFGSELPFLGNDSVVQLVNGLRPFAGDYREVGGLHPRPPASPGVLAYPVLRAAGCEWGAGTLSACSTALKGWQVGVSAIALFALYYLARSYLPSWWAVGVVGLSAFALNSIEPAWIHASTTPAVAAIFLFGRAFMDIAAGKARGESVWILRFAPVVVALTSMSMSPIFALGVILLALFHVREWRAWVKPVSQGILLAVIFAGWLYLSYTPGDGQIPPDGLEVHYLHRMEWRGFGVHNGLFDAARVGVTCVMFAILLSLWQTSSRIERFLGVAVIALFALGSVKAADIYVSNLNLRSGHAFAYLAPLAGMVLAHRLFPNRPARFALAGMLVAAVLVSSPGAFALKYLENDFPESWEMSMTPDIVRAARAHALAADNPKASWSFTTWHESMLYAALYGGRHETYGLGGVRESVIENRRIAGILPERGVPEFQPDYITAISWEWKEESVYRAEANLITAKWGASLENCVLLTPESVYRACFYKIR